MNRRLRLWSFSQVPLLAASAAIAFFAFCSMGCDSGGMQTYPAGGTVSFTDGTPLSAGNVSFRALDVKGNPSAKGEIQPDGSFKLSTVETEDGAVLGKHQAIVSAPAPRPPRGGGWAAPPVGPKIDARFSSYDTSGLEFTVTDDAGENQFKIEVTPPQ
jgi:hypothetical protein